MHMETHAGILELRAALRDLVAISTIPAAWVGREPPAIAAGLADVLLGSLGLDFAFVRLCDPNGGSEVEATRGNGWSGFPKWLSDHSVKGAFSCKEIVPDIGRGGQPCRGVVIPIGVNAEAGLAAAACGRADFPSEIDQLLLSVATNHAAAAFQDARLRNELDAKAAELRQARDNLEMKVAERTADLRRSEAYLAEAQRVSHTGSFGWSVSSGQIYWSDETFRILEWDQAHKPTIEFVLQRTHPEDRAFVEETLDYVARDRKAFDFEHRLLMPDGSVKFVRFVGHPSMDVESGSFDFVGAVTDITQSKRAEESLRQSEKELREVIETIPAMAFTRLPDGSGTFVNRRWTEYSGLSLEQTLGSHWQATIHPEDTDTHLNKWRASLSSGQPFENEVRHRSANGEYRWFLVRAVPLRDEHGNLLKWYGILTDIEDRKRAEAFLTGEKRILEMVAKGDSLPQILDSLCLFVEEQASSVLASILLVDGNRLRHGGAPSLPKAYTNAIDGGVIGPSVGSCGTAAYRGEQVIVEDIATDPLWADYREAALPHSLRACWSTPVFSSQGKVIATFAMYYREPRSPSPRDQETIEQITYLAGVAIERKLTQEVLRRSEAYLAEAQRMTHTGSWAWNVRTDALFWSEELLRIYDYDPEKMTASWDFFERVHPEDRPEIERRKKMESTQKEWAVSEIDFRIVLPDGTIKHLHSIAHPVMDESGEITEVVGTVMDVTERKRAEEERERLRQLEADLAHVNRVSMLGELAASLSHELKQPIAAAITNADTCLRWLRRDQPDIERASKAVTRTVRDGKRAAEIIDRLRSFYKQGAPAERELVDVNEVIREMLVLLRSEANRYSIPMRTDLAADLPRVSADRVPLQQVFLNLMLNGIEAMKDSGGELTIKSQLGNDGQLLISMSDNGVGLPSEKADQIFNAFFTTKPQGSGMGLAISRSIVESHGGRLWATANSGGGATFHFTLPTAAEVVKECATGT
jgi:PAS domain S-box-containing protein